MLSHLIDRIYKAEISPGRVSRIFRDYEDRLGFGAYDARCQAAFDRSDALAPSPALAEPGFEHLQVSTYFANGPEVARKSAEKRGTAIVFPDVVKTPARPAGPLPIPYPNIGGRSDKADETVKKQPLKVRKPGFAPTPSAPDRPAEPLRNGSGKTEYQLWMPDVKVDGPTTPRHVDLMTRNHG